MTSATPDSINGCRKDIPTAQADIAQCLDLISQLSKTQSSSD